MKWSELKKLVGSKWQNAEVVIPTNSIGEYDSVRRIELHTPTHWRSLTPSR